MSEKRATNDPQAEKDLVEATEAPEDPFHGYSELPGAEPLGRAIVDVRGQPSGSPANYEATRGRIDPMFEVRPPSANVIKSIQKDLLPTLKVFERDEEDDE